MIRTNIEYIKTVLDRKHFKEIIFYFFFSKFVAILEAVSIGVIPAIFAILIDKNLILEKIKFSESLSNFFLIFWNSENLFLIISISILIFFSLKTLIFFIFIFFESNLFNRIKINLSSNMFEIYLKKNYLFHSSNNPIILGRNITSEVNSTVAYIKNFLIIIKEIFQILLIGLILLIANFKISISIFLILTTLAFIYFKFIIKPFRHKIKISFFERGEKSKIVNQILNSIIEIKLYKKSLFFLTKFKDSITREFKSLVFYEVTSKIPRHLIELLIVGSIGFFIFYSSLIGLKIEGAITIVLLYFFAALRIYPSINNIIINRLGLVQNEVSVQAVYNNIKNQDKSIDNLDDDNSEYKFKSDIQIKNLSFNYPGRGETLKNIDLLIKKNDIIGIVGETGSGKSTLLKIIMGLIEHTGGEIKIDGVDIENIKNNWQNNFAYIPQNYYILDDTILNNIVFGEDTNRINFDLLQKCIKFAAIDDFINQLPDKLNTIVGPNGKKISGGQAQRLAIARAMYRNPNIIVLDEATNSLDEKTQKEILDKIYKLRGVKTIMIITHDHNILSECNKIYKIENGNLKLIK